MTMHPPKLVIFDCDGVLVDSEPLSLDVLVRVLRNAGVDMDAEEATERFLGKSLKTMSDILHDDYGLAVDDHFLEQMRLDLYQRFRQELQPVAGIATALDELDLPRCVASSSQIGAHPAIADHHRADRQARTASVQLQHGPSTASRPRTSFCMPQPKWRRRRKTASSSKTARPASRRQRLRGCGFSPLPAPRMHGPSAIWRPCGGFRLTCCLTTCVN